jgi:sporadic carbohydrate cluster protein (TIGR04323 family)
MKKKLRGYIFSRPFFNERVPQTIQNMVLRNYCEKNDYTFLLSFTEYTMKNSSFMLDSIFNNLKEIDGIVMYSFFQMPLDELKRNKIYEKILKNRKDLLFALEDRIFKDKKEIKSYEDLMNIKKYSGIFSNTLKSIKKYLK